MKFDAVAMRRAAEEAGGLLKSLASTSRLVILCRLVEGECPVGDLAAHSGLRPSTVSQHLALLRRERLVRARRDGQLVYYALVDEGARRVLMALHDIFCGPRAAAAPSPRQPRPKGKGRP